MVDNRLVSAKFGSYDIQRILAERRAIRQGRRQTAESANERLLAITGWHEAAEEGEEVKAATIFSCSLVFWAVVFGLFKLNKIESAQLRQPTAPHAETNWSEAQSMSSGATDFVNLTNTSLVHLTNIVFLNDRASQFPKIRIEGNNDSDLLPMSIYLDVTNVEFAENYAGTITIGTNRVRLSELLKAAEKAGRLLEVLR